MTHEFIPVATPQVGEEEAAAVRDVLLSGNYVSGRKVEEFERAFADYIGANHAVAVSTGTAAIYIALKAYGIGAGDEVIVPPLTFFATVSAVLYVGAKPVFADIDKDDLCISPESAAQKIGPRTRAIIPVHLYGAAAKMDELIEIARRNELILIEDCAQAHGTEYKNRKVGGIGDAGAFSFFATKHMTTGEGGMITTDDEDVARTCRIIRSHGMTGRDDHVLLGYNDRMTEMEAAMGLVQLKKLDRLNERRIAYSEFLLEKVKKMPWAIVPVPENHIQHTYFWCPVMVKASSGKTISDLKSHLRENRIGFRQRYDTPLYRQPVLSTLGLDYSSEYLPNVEEIAGNVIGLPNHPGLKEADLSRIIETLANF